MSRMTGPATRQALLDSGLQILDKEGLSGLSIENITRQAGVAKGTFYVHFEDRSSFLLGMHRDFHDRLRAKIFPAIGEAKPGRGRLLIGVRAYLDGCLQERATKALLFEARSIPEMRAAVERTNGEFAKLVATDFRSLLPRKPPALTKACAALFVAMCAEVALAELQAGSPLRHMRLALEELLP